MASCMVDDGVRVIRLAAFSITATVLALGAHVLAGGTPPAFSVTVAAVALPAVAARALVRRRRRLVEISVVLGAVQVALHEVFHAFPTTSIVEGAAGHAAHVGHAAHPWMPVTHTVAVLLTGALLAHGEQMLALLLTWWRSLPRRRRATFAVPSLWVHRLVASAPGAPTSILRWVFAPVVRRGPPARMC